MNFAMSCANNCELWPTDCCMESWPAVTEYMAITINKPVVRRKIKITAVRMRNNSIS